MAAALTAAVAGPAMAEPAKKPADAPDPKIKHERISNLGLFSGYVVACGLASEAEADEMVRKLSEGLSDPFDADDTETFDKARKAARKVECNEGPLRDAVTQGWKNYREAK